MVFDTNSIGNRMLEYRIENKLSQRDFAKLAKISSQTVCSVERGVQTPTPITISKILKVIESKGE